MLANQSKFQAKGDASLALISSTTWTTQHREISVQYLTDQEIVLIKFVKKVSILYLFS